MPRVVRSESSVVGPPRNGWIGVYDDVAAGQPEQLRRLASELSYVSGGVVVALGVEEGEVVRLVAYDRGRVADEYLSVPEYYGPLPPGDAIAMRANPTLLGRSDRSEAGRDPNRGPHGGLGGGAAAGTGAHGRDRADARHRRRRPVRRRGVGDRRRGQRRALVNVVLLHAFPLDERMWEPQLAALDEDVYVPNFYDLGGNSVDGWAEHVLERIDGDLVAVGASLGGYVALAMARAAPDRVKGLLLAGARATADPPERRAAREEMIRVVQAEGIEGWNREFAPPGPGDRTTDELVRGIQALRDRRDATDVVAGFRGPLTVVVGDRDEILPVDEARQIAESAPDASFEVVEGAGHVVSVDAPDRFNEILRAFLNRAG